MDVFTLRIHMYNNILWIVGIKLVFLLQKKGTNFNDFEKHCKVWYCVVVGVGEAEVVSEGNEVYCCVIGWCCLAPNRFANV